MKTTNLRLLSFFLLGLAALPLAAGIVMQIQQQHIRSRMKEKLEKQYLHTVILPTKEVKWIKPGKEIWLNGKMFDIKTVAFENNSYTFTGLYDHEETLLVLRFEENHRQQDNNGLKLLYQLWQLLQTPYDQEAREQHCSLIFKPDFVNPQQSAFNSRQPDIVTPPPRFS